MYFVLALWLFRGRNCGYGQVMTRLADGLYHQRRAVICWEGQLDPDGWLDAGGSRRWKPPNISSLSRGRGKLGPAPVRFLFEQVTGLIGDEQDPGVSTVRPIRPARAFPQVRWLAAAESGTRSLLGHR